MDDYRHNDKKYIKWAQVVKVKDGFICQVCGQKGGKLESHHKNSWDRASEEERYSLGSSTLLNVLIANSEYTTARTNFISAQFSYIQLSEQLKYLLGELEYQKYE